ncbi:Deoxyguanosinetriphosphate triphosphohydrolase [Polystyrenella longa]|uniref:Deoxyguanosinetriphosphate triphosphohydrolase n=1 Tax=Polystyrenella longa TaxID=2528007 RepID=A0A518CTK7_9PLAN|nr:dNTP triphosphohydrolase [Polystyrenella longa]QDU82548.1 Deoxyguanosinetriphosphate triphosphohydrolase [Polystyrenella longa]
MPHKLSWKKLLSPERVPRPDSSPSKIAKPYVAKEDERTPFEQDYDRIVFSSPFRRLARKTQVHPMASNDHIHNRLTHSIEVSSVGRSFASRVANLAAKRSDLSESDISNLPWILQSACLIHDLGNPPFGHAGEEVIRDWAKDHLEFLIPEGRFSNPQIREDCKLDWLNFEGNAQGFRLASRRDNPMPGYLRLTYASLSAAVKYPWASSDPRAVRKRKHNVYSTEFDIFHRMSDELGLVTEENQWCRHPLSFLTEAADDICYRIIDPEDAVEMGICKYDQVHELFLRIARNPEIKWMSLPQLRGQAIKSLMDQFWEVFENDFDAIMNGERVDDLKSSLGSECTEQLNEVSTIYNSIFAHRKKITTELGAYHVLDRILTAMVKTIQSIADSDTYADVHFLSKRTLELTWGQKYVEENLQQPYSWWLSQVMDYVSGMTDDYATRLSREIWGLAGDGN